MDSPDLATTCTHTHTQHTYGHQSRLQPEWGSGGGEGGRVCGGVGEGGGQTVHARTAALTSEGYMKATHENLYDKVQIQYHQEKEVWAPPRAPVPRGGLVSLAMQKQAIQDLKKLFRISHWCLQTLQVMRLARPCYFLPLSSSSMTTSDELATPPNALKLIAVVCSKRVPTYW